MTFEMLTEAFRDSTTSTTQVQLWYNRFKEGQEDVNDDARHGQCYRWKFLRSRTKKEFLKKKRRT